MSEDRAYRVFKIENGTVIDHIKSPLALKIIDILKLQGDGIISIGMNFDSDKTEKKDIIKIENLHLSKAETDIIALVSPTATINIIKNGRVIEKRQLEMPEEVFDILKCQNPACVTNHFHDCPTRFEITKATMKHTLARCVYCERETEVTTEMMR